MATACLPVRAPARPSLPASRNLICSWMLSRDCYTPHLTSIIQYLADTNPNYEGKDKVRELMAQAKKHSGVKPGATAKPLN
jgi:hypothetical protein